MDKENKFVPVKEFRNRNNCANTYFFKLLDKHTDDWNRCNNGQNIEEKGRYSEAFKKEWNNWVKVSNLEQELDFSYFNFDLTDKEIRDLFSLLINEDFFILSEFLDFGGMHFPPANFSNSFLCTSFKASKFVKVYFEGASFSGVTNFSNVVFSQEASFSSTIFHGLVTFEQSVFSKEVSFADACFYTEVSFLSVKFSGETCFNNVDFICQCGLKEEDQRNTEEEVIQYFMKCNFGDTIFCENADFQNLVLHEDVLIDFNCAVFQNTVVFQDLNCKGNNEISFKGAEFNKSAFFSFSDARDISFIIADARFLSYVSFDIRNVGQLIDFASANFPNIKNLRILDKRKKKTVLLSYEENYRFLKLYYKQNLDFELEHQYFVLELEEKYKFAKNPLSWPNSVLNFCYKIFSNYGNSVMRPLTWLILFSLLFCVLFYQNDIEVIHSIIRTINPMYFRFIYNTPITHGFTTIIMFQTLINLCFLFLIGLGLKNRFHIK